MITLPGPADVCAVPISKQRVCSVHACMSVLSADYFSLCSHIQRHKHHYFISGLEAN